jgi:hypothetical protein
MRKALAILATVATVGATAVSAPAQARGWGWGPGIGLGLAAGALAAGAYGAYGPYGYYGPGYGYYGYGPGYYRPAYYGYIAARITDPDMGPMPIMVMAGRIIGTAIGGTGNEQPGASLRALHGPAPACDLSPADC